MSNLGQRILTGIILLLVISSSIILGFYSFILLIAAINLLGLSEFYRLFHSPDISPQRLNGLALSLIILITCMLTVSGTVNWKFLLINIPAAFAVFVTELYRRKKYPFHNLALTFLGIGCISIPLCFFSSLAFLNDDKQYNYQIVFGYFLILWANDSGAFLIGKYAGRRPLFKRISPNKTWEGSLGGATCALLVTSLTSRFFTSINSVDWVVMAIIIVVAGTFGDLVKSLMKRSLGIKDSGTILPGHGGMLDRFDSLLGSAPFVFGYLALTSYA